MKILIDTNIYLDFYRSRTNALKLLDVLSEHYNKIILTDQIIQEFHRSRETVIKAVKSKFEKESALEDYSSSYLQNLKEFADLVVLQKQYRAKRNEVIAALDSIIQSPAGDPVASAFSDFANHAMRKNTVYNTSDTVIQKAQKRKLIGNPPVSDKYSIGDEINWEIILENINEDIIIVGRDKTYTDNFSFLKIDFHKHTGHLIAKLTGNIIEALDAAGVETSDELKTAEKVMIEDIKHYGDFWMHVANDGMIEE